MTFIFEFLEKIGEKTAPALDFLIFGARESLQEWLFVMISSVVSFIVVTQVIALIRLLVINKLVGLRSHRFPSRTISGGKRILIIGDSTVVGAGASNKNDSIPGRLARDFPHTEVINLAQNGATTSQVRHQLEPIKNQKFNLIIISTGGNDLFKKRLSDVGDSLHYVLKTAKKMSGGNALLLLYGKVAGVLAVPYLFRWFFLKKADRLQKILTSIAKLEGVPYIELFTEDRNNPFIMHPTDYLAADRIHPNSLGYEMWYNRMWLEMVRNGYTFTE